VNDVESKVKNAGILGGALLAAVLLASCGAAGAGSGGGTGGGALGATFTLPAGSIDLWENAEAGEARVELRDAAGEEILYPYGPVTVSDNLFPGLEVGPPSAESLLTWADVKGSWEEEFSGAGVSLSVSDEDVELQLIDGLHAFNGESSVTGSPDLVRESAGSDGSVSWVYVDRDVEVSGGGSATLFFGDSAFTVTVSVDLSLKAGWNSVRGTETFDATSSLIEFFDGPEPGDAIWLWDVDDGQGGEGGEIIFLPPGDDWGNWDLLL
jgi:hypothetical protein